MNHTFDDALARHGLNRADAIAGLPYLHGRWHRVIKERLEGRTHEQIASKRNGWFWNPREIEDHALYLLTRHRFDGPEILIPTAVRDVVAEVRRREVEQGRAWLGPLAFFLEVTS